MATYNADPDSVELLKAMGLDHTDAVDCLKACNNDLNQAAEYYFNGDLAKARESLRWDDSAWAAPREGPQTPAQDGHSYSTNYIPSFEIQAADDVPSGTLEGLKSRPPSRISMRPDVGAQDPELAQALANSMHDISNHGQQETGITGTRNSPINSNFAPAQPNKQYDPSQWALTTTQAQEIIPEPPAQERQREARKPAFLRPSSSQLLAGGITIMHAIPAVRSAFLDLEHVQDDYGYHDKWWNGETISVSRVISLDGGINEQGLDFLAELQRLMVFLDQTERAYGSADSVIRLADYTESDFSTMSVTRFLEAWDGATKQAYKDEVPTTAPFRNVAHERRQDGTSNDQEFICLELGTRPDDTLYSAIDQALWGAEADAYITFGDVLCIRVTPEAGSNTIGATFPLNFYPDRYTEAWLETTQFLRGQIEEAKATLVELDFKAERMTRFQKKNAMGQPEGKSFDPRELLKITIDHYATPITDAATGNNSDDVGLRPNFPDPTEKLKEILSKLEAKLGDLESRQQQAKQALRELQASYTDPETCDKPLTRYTLRGASLSPCKLYILLPAHSADVEPSPTLTPAGEQWWRIEWSHNASNTGWDDTRVQFSVDKVPATEVVEAISAADSAVVFYASDKALQPSTEDANKNIPEALQSFVDRDNITFRSELQPSSSPEKKRRHSSWLEDELTDNDAMPNTYHLEHSSASPKRTSRRSNSSETLNGYPTSDPVLPSSPTAGGGIPPPPPPRYPGFGGGNIVEQMVELPPMQEMKERGGHVSPVAQVFHFDRRRKGRTASTSATGGAMGSGQDMSGNPITPHMPDSDFEMPDSEHVEYANTGILGDVPKHRRKGG